jgi:hypothetical protein
VKRFIRPLIVIAAVALVAFTLYRNVYSADPDTRAKAMAIADEHAACGKACKHTREEETFHITARTYSYGYENGRRMTVRCARPYIAFGAYACQVTQ